MAPNLAYYHIPGLFVATAYTFGGMIPLISAPAAMKDFGLPLRIRQSQEAQKCFVIQGSRATLMGVALYSFYWTNNLAAMDILLAVQVYGATADGWILWNEGEKGTGIWRMACGIFFGLWGLYGMSSYGSR